MSDLKILTKEILDDPKNWSVEKIEEYKNIRAVMMIVEMYNITGDDKTNDDITTTAILSNNVPNLTELVDALKYNSGQINLDPYMIFETTIKFIELSVEIINNIENAFDSKTSEYDQKEFNELLNSFKTNIINNYEKMLNDVNIIKKISILHNKIIESYNNELKENLEIKENEKVAKILSNLMRLKTSLTAQLITKNQNADDIDDILDNVKESLIDDFEDLESPSKYNN